MLVKTGADLAPIGGGNRHTKKMLRPLKSKVLGRLVHIKLSCSRNIDCSMLVKFQFGTSERLGQVLYAYGCHVVQCHRE